MIPLIKPFKNLFWSVFILFGFVETIVVIRSYITNERNIQDTLHLETLYLHKHTAIAKENLKKEAELFYHFLICKPQMREIMAQASATQDPQEQAILRDKLYTLFSKTYRSLTRHGVRQLQFHLANTNSFLRFHRPTKFGDFLGDTRESLNYVRKNRVSLSCFEEGRIYNGFRNIYPLFKNKLFIGSVEISFSVLALQEEMLKVDKSSYLFLVKDEIIDQKVFKSETDHYQKSQFKGFSYDKETLNNTMQFSLDKLYYINQNIHTKVAKKLKEGLSFAVMFQDKSLYQNQMIVINFEAIKNLQNETVAYLINYSFTHFITILTQNAYQHLLEVSFLFMTLSVIFFLMLRNKAEKNKIIHELAMHDRLTGIFNRYAFDELLVERLNTSRDALSFIFFDIDFFKKVNDTYGHDIGDYVLQNIVKLISKEIRKEDIFARWGGEEFIIMLPDTTIDEAIAIAQKLRYEIETHAFYEIETITCSFGVTQWKEDENKISLFKRVDGLLYQAKEAGRNCVISDKS